MLRCTRRRTCQVQPGRAVSQRAIATRRRSPTAHSVMRPPRSARTAVIVERMKSSRRSSQKSTPAAAAPKAKLPHVRDQSPGSVGTEPRKVIQQAYKDLQAGLVDTDMRATPGLDAQRRNKLVRSTSK